MPSAGQIHALAAALHEERVRAHLSLGDVPHHGSVWNMSPAGDSKMLIFSTLWGKACPHCSGVTASL